MILPVTAQLDITQYCTHKCNHCYNGINPIRKGGFVTEEIAERIAKIEIFDITLTGGEPLINKNRFYKIVDIFNKEYVTVRVNSNLHTFNKEDVYKFKDKGIESILTSILGDNSKVHDELTQRRGAFDKLKKSLSYLSGQEIYLGVNMVVTPENKNRIYPTGKMLYNEFGINSFSATPVVPPLDDTNRKFLDRDTHISILNDLIRLSDEFDMTTASLHPVIPCMFDDRERARYKKFIDSKTCAAAKGSVAFSSNGDIRVCPQEWKIYGNILQNSMNEVIKRMKPWWNNEMVPQECSPCEYMDSCRGGCRVASNSFNGSLNATEPYFRGAIKEKLIKSKKVISVENLQIPSKQVRYRQDDSDVYTIYYHPNAYMQVNKKGLNIFRRYLAGQNFKGIVQETGDYQGIKNLSELFVKRNLLNERKIK